MMPNNQNNKEIGEDLQITEVTKAPGGHMIWVSGTVDGHLFSVMMNDRPGVISNWEINNSQITSLSLHRLQDNQTVYRWDNSERRPAIDDRARAVIEFLTDGAFTELILSEGTDLSKHAFSEELARIADRQRSEKHVGDWPIDRPQLPHENVPANSDKTPISMEQLNAKFRQHSDQWEVSPKAAEPSDNTTKVDPAERSAERRGKVRHLHRERDFGPEF